MEMYLYVFITTITLTYTASTPVLILNISTTDTALFQKKSPIVCPPKHEITRVEINHDYQCDDFISDKESKVKETVWVAILERNEYGHTMDAYHCEVEVVTRCRRRANIIPYGVDEEQPDFHFHEQTPISQCKLARDTKITNYGPLTIKGNSLWTTNNQITNPETSYGQTRTWECTTTKNLMLVKTTITVDQDNKMSSPSGPMTICVYSSGECSRTDNSTILWTLPQGDTRDPWIPYDIIKMDTFRNQSADLPRLMMTTADESHKMALIFDDKYQGTKPNRYLWNGCTEDHLKMPCQKSSKDKVHLFMKGEWYTIYNSKSGLSFIMTKPIIPKKEEVRTPSFMKLGKIFQEHVGWNVRRKKRELAMTDTLAAEIQALLVELQAGENKVSKMLMYQMCQKKEADSKYFLAMANTPEGATQLARTMTDLQNVAGRISGSWLTITACFPLNGGDYVIVPMNNTCTKEIPIRYRLQNEGAGMEETTHLMAMGYMNPRTRIITRTATYIDCDQVGEVPLDFDPPIFVNGPTGHTGRLTGDKTRLFFSDSPRTVQSLVVVPKFYGLSSHVLNDGPRWEDNAQFVGRLQAVTEKLWVQSGREKGNLLDDHKEYLDTLWASISLWNIVPSFTSHPGLRLYCLLCNITYTVQFICQVFLPGWLARIFWEWFGIGRVIGKLTDRMREKTKKKFLSQYEADTRQLERPLVQGLQDPVNPV